MSKSSSIMMWASAVLLVGVYLFPLWTIDLKAPQYPNGLGINIWIDKITGREPHDLQNINGLNHYIGMKTIEPDEIPELRYMKYISGFLILLAGAVALTRRRWLLVAFVVIAVGVAAVGMYDFWKWEYDYGHNLDPDAAIKVPGMSYQPPLFGSKQLLNFTSTAWPGIGGWSAMASVALGILALFKELVPLGGSRRGRGAAAGLAAAAAFALPLAGCAQGPQPIEYGKDACGFCRMTITDSRYGTEVVTSKGRVHKYDSIECLASDLARGGGVSADDARGIYVTDFLQPNTLIDATAAVFLHSEALPSPMGMNLTAVSSKDGSARLQEKHGGTVMDWQETREFVAKEKHFGH